jgi:ADP-heptose:LPS heptosyltransferase
VITRIFVGMVRKYIKTIRVANAARDAKNYRKAAFLYEIILRLSPNDAAIHIQCGHMFKEAGDLGKAERHYERAAQLTPNDPDLSLQLGHFYKIAGRPEAAERSYRRAVELRRDWLEPALHLRELYKTAWRNHTRSGSSSPEGSRVRQSASDRPVEAGAECDWKRFPVAGGLAPELAPQPARTLLRSHAEEIAISRLGQRQRTHWGMRRTLRGIDAIRGFCISAVPIRQLHAAFNGLRFHSMRPDGFPLKYERDDPNKAKYVFNVWYDFSNFARGLHQLELQFVDDNGGVRVFREEVVIDDPAVEECHPGSDRLVSFAARGDLSIEEQVNARPSMIRPARRSRLPAPVRNVLVQRVDQLGDLVCSIPALRRLRELLPDARLVGLLSSANAELARSLDLFDEIITADFPEDAWQRRRIMPLDTQHELRLRLQPYNFDVAIDLIESNASRPLLLLSGAPFLFGFRDDDSPWLAATYEVQVRDPFSGASGISQTAKVLGMIEWLGVLLNSYPEAVKRENLSTDLLRRYGLSSTDRYAVLHTGSRLKFNQWPYFDELAAMLLDRTDLKVVMMTDEPPAKTPEVATSDRLLRVGGRLPFDDFDALLSFCGVFVGNDSGPKNLASLRGANVVSIHMARTSWNEWGQEIGGTIISRRVPCASCGIHFDPEECGKGFACIANIRVEEVFGAVVKLL